jgi:hypothetical protein
MKMVMRLSVWAALLLAAFPVAAAGPTVALVPTPLEIPVGQTVPLDVNITDVQGLYGFEMELSFDPAVVEVVDADPAREGTQLLPGDFLSLDLLVRNQADNVAGTAEYVLTQINPSQAKSGSGKLLTLYLKGKAAGQNSVIEIVKAQFASRDGERIEAILTNGQARVTAAATPVAGDTPLPTATLLPTAAAPQIVLTPVPPETPADASPNVTATPSIPAAPSVAATEVAAATFTPFAAQTEPAPDAATVAPADTVPPADDANATTEPVEAAVHPVTGTPAPAGEAATDVPATVEATPRTVAQAAEQKTPGVVEAPVAIAPAATATAAVVQPRNNALLFAGAGLLALAAAVGAAILVLRRKI